MERQAEHKVIKSTRHFISVSNQDSNDYGSASHNPAMQYITFNNTGFTNVQSYNDSTTTTLFPITLTADIFYQNIYQGFRNNRFRISSITDDARPAFARNGVSESVSPITLTLADSVIKSGADLATALTSSLNNPLFPIGWINPFVSNVPHTGSSAFVGAYVQSATTALAANAILITNVTAALRSTTAGGGLATATAYRADTNALVATSAQSAVTNVTQQVTFNFPAGSVLPTNATGIYFRFAYDNGVIGDWSYGTAGGNLSMSASTQTNIANFAVTYDAGTSALTLAYNVNAPASVAAVNPILVLNTSFTHTDGFTYDSSRLWGATGSIIAGIYIIGSFQLPYANRVAGLALPNYVDLQTLQVLRVHSNVARRHFAKIGAEGAPATQRNLALTDILFEIPLDSVLGQTMTWTPPDSRYAQEISSNFDELHLRFTDNKNVTIPFIQTAEINFTFAIEREVIVPNNEERIKALMNYNQFKSY